MRAAASLARVQPLRKLSGLSGKQPPADILAVDFVQRAGRGRCEVQRLGPGRFGRDGEALAGRDGGRGAWNRTVQSAWAKSQASATCAGLAPRGGRPQRAQEGAVARENRRRSARTLGAPVALLDLVEYRGCPAAPCRPPPRRARRRRTRRCRSWSRRDRRRRGSWRSRLQHRRAGRARKSPCSRGRPPSPRGTAAPAPLRPPPSARARFGKRAPAAPPARRRRLGAPAR